MVILQISLQNRLSIPTAGLGFRARKSGGRTGVAEIRSVGTQNSKIAADHERGQKSTVDVDRLVEFLYEDLSHAFDEQGIDRTAYEEDLKFRDPITKYDDINGFMLNIAMLQTFLRPDFNLHWVKKTGAYEITTRWTAVMKFVTGTSIMTINPLTGKFCCQVDRWDSVQNNDYFSLEGLWDVFKQFRFYETPEFESPKYQILKRTANYEVRKYEPFMLVQKIGDKISAGFSSVACLSDGEQKEEKLVSLRKMEGGNNTSIAAVLKFSGNPTEETVQKMEKQLRYYLEKDGLKPIHQYSLLARYNDSTRTWSFLMRNEVILWLEEFSMQCPQYLSSTDITTIISSNLPNLLLNPKRKEKKNRNLG